MTRTAEWPLMPGTAALWAMTVQTSAAQPIPATRSAWTRPEPRSPARADRPRRNGVDRAIGDRVFRRGRDARSFRLVLPAAEPGHGTIESDGPPIVVERSTYWAAGGQFWAAGTSALLPRLP